MKITIKTILILYLMTSCLSVAQSSNQVIFKFEWTSRLILFEFILFKKNKDKNLWENEQTKYNAWERAQDTNR
jgi:hypothetical protein